jgi:tetratricopeptide (TPR) repeat protein
VQEPPLNPGAARPIFHPMALKTTRHQFEIRFFEGVLRRNPRDTDVIEILGGLYTREGRIDEGLRMDRRLVRLLPENATAHYNLACSLALKNRRSDAMRALERAVELGYRDVEWLLQDPDLEGLKGHPAFKALVAHLSPES